MSTELVDRPAEVAIAPPLLRYMRKCGGKDVLVFDTPRDAGIAAHIMRERGLMAEARYDKVFISCVLSDDTTDQPRQVRRRGGRT